eukprot:8176276-Pyramimonas_sp.AAC.1
MQFLPLPSSLKQIELGCLSQDFRLPLGNVGPDDWVHLQDLHGPKVYPLEIVSAATMARTAIHALPGRDRVFRWLCRQNDSSECEDEL